MKETYAQRLTPFRTYFRLEVYLLLHLMSFLRPSQYVFLFSSLEDPMLFVFRTLVSSQGRAYRVMSVLNIEFPTTRPPAPLQKATSLFIEVYVRMVFYEACSFGENFGAPLFQK